MADNKNDRTVMDAWVAAWEADVAKTPVAKVPAVTQREYDLAEDPNYKGHVSCADVSIKPKSGPSP